MLLVYFINFLLADEIATYTCSPLTIELHDTAEIQCDYEHFTLNYDEFSHNEFTIRKFFRGFNDFVTFINKSINIYSFESNMAKIASSIQFNQRTNLIFKDFMNESTILAASKLFDSNLTDINIWINMSWNEYMNYTYCPWLDGKYYNQYLFVKDYFDNITYSYKSRWRKVCFRYSGYLVYQDEPNGEITFIPTSTLVGGIIAAVLLIIAVIVSLYFIAHYRFKKDFDEMTDESLDEDIK